MLSKPEAAIVFSSVLIAAPSNQIRRSEALIISDNNWNRRPPLLVEGMPILTNSNPNPTFYYMGTNANNCQCCFFRVVPLQSSGRAALEILAPA